MTKKGYFGEVKTDYGFGDYVIHEGKALGSALKHNFGLVYSMTLSFMVQHFDKYWAPFVNQVGSLVGATIAGTLGWVTGGVSFVTGVGQIVMQYVASGFSFMATSLSSGIRTVMQLEQLRLLQAVIVEFFAGPCLVKQGILFFFFKKNNLQKAIVLMWQ